MNSRSVITYFECPRDIGSSAEQIENVTKEGRWCAIVSYIPLRFSILIKSSIRVDEELDPVININTLLVEFLLHYIFRERECRRCLV